MSPVSRARVCGIDVLSQRPIGCQLLGTANPVPLNFPAASGRLPKSAPQYCQLRARAVGVTHDDPGSRPRPREESDGGDVERSSDALVVDGVDDQVPASLEAGASVAGDELEVARVARRRRSTSASGSVPSRRRAPRERAAVLERGTADESTRRTAIGCRHRCVRPRDKREVLPQAVYPCGSLGRWKHDGNAAAG